MVMISFLRKLGLEYLFTPAKKSMKRRETFSSNEEAVDYFASKSLFREIPRSTIELYVNHGLKEVDGERVCEAEVAEVKEPRRETPELEPRREDGRPVEHQPPRPHPVVHQVRPDCFAFECV